MAPAPKQRPGRALLGILIVLIAMYLGVFLGPSSTPALGLDLRGGTEVTLSAQPLRGNSISKGDLNQAVNIIRNRVNGLGVGGAEINTQGNKNIVVSLPGKNSRQVIDTVGETALLRFRQVLAIGAYTASPTPSTSTSTQPSTTATPKAGHSK